MEYLGHKTGQGGVTVSPHLQHWDPRLYQAAADTPPARSPTNGPCVIEPYARTTNTSIRYKGDGII